MREKNFVESWGRTMTSWTLKALSRKAPPPKVGISFEMKDLLNKKYQQAVLVLS